MDLKPKETKTQVLNKLFKEFQKEIKRYYNFWNCHKNMRMREILPAKECPVCGKQTAFSEFEIHHKTYSHKCFYAYDNPPCARCWEEHPECFEKCKSKLVYVHPWCHAKIHGFKRKENNDEE